MPRFFALVRSERAFVYLVKHRFRIRSKHIRIRCLADCHSPQALCRKPHKTGFLAKYIMFKQSCQCSQGKRVVGINSMVNSRIAVIGYQPKKPRTSVTMAERRIDEYSLSDRASISFCVFPLCRTARASISFMPLSSSISQSFINIFAVPSAS